MFCLNLVLASIWVQQLQNMKSVALVTKTVWQQEGALQGHG
jgi:hypothetical protein